jgi:hypothetical protein
MLDYNDRPATKGRRGEVICDRDLLAFGGAMATALRGHAKRYGLPTMPTQSGGHGTHLNRLSPLGGLAFGSGANLLLR